MIGRTNCFALSRILAPFARIGSPVSRPDRRSYTIPQTKIAGDTMKITVYGFIVLTFIGGWAASANAQIARPTPTPAVAARPTPTPAPANAPVPPSKIALVDTSMFGDEKSGIYRFVDATRAVAAE